MSSTGCLILEDLGLAGHDRGIDASVETRQEEKTSAMICEQVDC